MTTSMVQPESALPGLGRRLEDLLTALMGEHRALLDLTARQRDAIRAADTRAMEACLAEQRARLGRIASLEEERRALVEVVIPGGSTTLSHLASLTGAEERDRLLSLASELRRLVERVREELALIRSASVSLLGHVEGVMKQVAQRLSHAQTYGRRGAVEPRVTVVSSLDLTR